MSVKGLAVALAALACVAAMPTQSTRRRAPKGAAASSEAPAPDTVAAPDSAVTFRGYDKPLRASRETVLATNHTADTLLGVEVRVRYYDLRGHRLHQEVRWADCDLPPADTRLLAFPTWDANRSYYYHLGAQPRTPNVTPYTVTCRALRMAVRRKSDK